MVSGQPPIRAKKLRYYEDPDFRERVLPAPVLSDGPYLDRPAARPDDWSDLAPVAAVGADEADAATSDPANGGIRQEPELPEHEEIVPTRVPTGEFTFEDEPDDDAPRQRLLTGLQTQVTRAAALDHDDGLGLLP